MKGFSGLEAVMFLVTQFVTEVEYLYICISQPYSVESFTQ